MNNTIEYTVYSNRAAEVSYEQPNQTEAVIVCEVIFCIFAINYSNFQVIMCIWKITIKAQNFITHTHDFCE